jgi:hypothetical protein
MSLKNLEEYKKRFKKRLTSRSNGKCKSCSNKINKSMVVENLQKQVLCRWNWRNIVQKYDPRRTHTQSAPLSPPASDTGFLVSQITMNVKKTKWNC